MSRSVVILLLIFLVIVGGAILLSSLDTEVVPTTIEQDVTNEALAK